MRSKIWLINMLLAVGVASLGWKAYEVWSDGEMHLPEAQPAKESPSARAVPSLEILSVPEAEFQGVVDNNLFWPDRSPNEPQQPVVEVEAPPPPSGPDEKLIKMLEAPAKRINLFGVMIVDGKGKALISSPPPSPVSGKRTSEKGVSVRGAQWVEVGESIDRFQVKEITHAGMVLTAEGLEFPILLYDQDRARERAPVQIPGGPIVISTATGAVPESPVPGPGAAGDQTPQIEGGRPEAGPPPGIGDPRVGIPPQPADAQTELAPGQETIAPEAPAMSPRDFRRELLQRRRMMRGDEG